MKMKIHFKLLTSLSLLFLLAGHSALTYSAEEGAEESTEVSIVTTNESSVQANELESPDTEPSIATQTTEDEAPSAPSEERFIPSTQISEDLSVSFPVNI